MKTFDFSGKRTQSKEDHAGKPTWIEIGLWAIFIVGSLLGTMKRYGPVSPEIISLAYDVLCFGLLGYVVIKRIIHSRRVPYSPLTVPVAGFCAYTLLTILGPEVTSLERGILGWRFLASSMLLHFLGFYAFDDVRRIRRLMSVFWITGGLVAAYGMIQLLRGYNSVELAWISDLAATMKIAGTGRYRLMATTGSAVDLGFFMSLSAVSLFGALLFLRSERIWRSLLLGLSILTLLFTFVRAAWVATFIGIVYLSTAFLWQKKWLRMLFPSLMILLLIVMIALPSVAEYLSPMIEDPALQERIGSLARPIEDKSMRDRFDRWEESWVVVQEYPWGIGVGMTGAASLREPGESGPAPVTTDNSYLKVLVELGWIGLGLFVWLMLSVLKRALRHISYLQGEYRVLAVMLLATFFSFAVISFFGEYVESNPARSIVWIFTGLLFSLSRLQNSRS